ncbi:uncharacterized protein [Littorina saxatilis]|uniref:uncharacterized protein n=1 Tax=Littorina saxatilis TaxID=31220 RepID=UPI0038B5F119
MATHREISAASAKAGTCYAIVFQKCDHLEQTKLISRYPTSTTLHYIYEDIHSDLLKGYEVQCLGSESLSGENGFELDWGLSLGELKSFNIKSLHFKCSQIVDADVEATEMPSVSQPANAFQVLMGSAKARSLPKPKAESCGKTSGLNRKDELYDDVLNYLAAKGADFPQVTADQEGAYFTQVLTNALWYATSHHLTINDRANKVHGVLPIPEEFEQFAGYNEIINN